MKYLFSKVALIISACAFSMNLKAQEQVPGDGWVPKSLDDCLDCLVTLESESGQGSGFITKELGGFYVYTNTHVAVLGDLKIYDSSRNKISDIVRVECASEKGVDLTRLKLRNPRSQYLTLATGPAKLKSKLIALGNSHGEGVNVMLEGVLQGIGAKEIDMTCEIVPGNSGGPVVMDGSFEVIGVSTRLIRSEHWTSANTSQGNRRLATRCDGEAGHRWSANSLSKLHKAAQAIEHTYETTRVLGAVLEFTPSNHGFLYSSETAKKVREEHAEHPIIKSAQNISNMLASARSKGKNWSKGDLSKHYLKFYSYAMNYASSDFKKSKRLATSGFHKGEFADFSLYRKKVANLYKKQIREFVSNPRKIWVSR